MRQVNLDCEGPITKNDNALELCQHFIPEGGRLFSLISRYDDFLADVLKRRSHKAGSTLKFILPFLKAYGATNEKVRKYSLRNLILMPGARKLLSSIKDRMPTFIISTSYRPYIEALCEAVGFPLENTYSTSFDLDRYKLAQEEIRKLRELTQEIISLPQIDLSGVRKEEDLSSEAKKSIQRLDEIFNEEIFRMRCGRMLREVNPMGGQEKAEAVLSSLRKTGGKLSEVMYIGDSITDVEALQLIRQEGGVAISFNGNRYAIDSAEIACISPHTFPLLILAEIFYKEGREGVMRQAKRWPQGLDEKLREKLFTVIPFPCVEVIDEENRERLIGQSEEMRIGTRGMTIGGLG